MQASEVEQVGLSPKDKAEKRIGQAEIILAMLKAAGSNGLNSEELNRVAFRYAAVLFRLRAAGHQIDTVGRRGTELCRYIYRGHVIACCATQEELF